MLAYERQGKILELLKKHDTLTVEDLVKTFPDFSESTIRRDLRILEANGKIITFHGGDVMLKKKNYEDTYYDKSLLNLSAKQKIAKEAAKYLKNGDVIYLDASSTCFEMLPFINKDITIVTNTVNYQIFDEYDFDVYLIGGKVMKASSYCCFDTHAVNALKNFNFDYAFLGCGGINHKFGITYPKSEQALFQQVVCKHSKNVLILADDAKFKNAFSGKAFSINTHKILTNKIPEDYKQYTNIKAIK